jgi:hypothetical protein
LNFFIGSVKVLQNTKEICFSQLEVTIVIGFLQAECIVLKLLIVNHLELLSENKLLTAKLLLAVIFTSLSKKRQVKVYRYNQKAYVINLQTLAIKHF